MTFRIEPTLTSIQIPYDVQASASKPISKQQTLKLMAEFLQFSIDEIRKARRKSQPILRRL